MAKFDSRITQTYAMCQIAYDIHRKRKVKPATVGQQRPNTDLVLVKDFPYDQTNSLSAARDPIPVVGNVTASIQVGISQYTIP